MRKVLLIEDSIDTRQLYRLLLRHAGWSVIEAESAEEGVVLADRYQPNLIILDLRLPGKGGLDILADLRRRHPDAPVVVVSGEPDHERQALDLGAAAYITKPFDPWDELLPTIESALADR